MGKPLESRDSDQPTATVRAYSRRFHNIYLFVTEACQLRCGHCYMGDRLERGEQMGREKAMSIIAYCQRLGAEFITFVGGEPTLHPDLAQLVSHSRQCGYTKVMIDTNGHLPERIAKIPPSDLFYVRVSLDGANDSSHDKVRGSGTFQKAVAGVEWLVANGYDVRLTCTIFAFNKQETDAFLSLADRLGVSLVNFHSFSEEGYGLENRDWSLSPSEWIEFCRKLTERKGNYKVAVRYPPTWAAKEDLNQFVSEGFRGCLGCSLDRLSIFPDGRCYVCSVLFDEEVNFANMTDSGLQINKEATTNEYELFTRAALQSPLPQLMGCPAEELLNKKIGREGPANLVSVCRLWRREL